jgi:hypothetical protein
MRKGLLSTYSVYCFITGEGGRKGRKGGRKRERRWSLHICRQIMRVEMRVAILMDNR